MTAQAWLGLALGVLIGVVYAALQRWSLHDGPRPNAVVRPLAGSVVRLVALMLAVLAVLRFTDANRVFLVIGIMVSYGVMFVMMMWRVMWKKNDRS